MRWRPSPGIPCRLALCADRRRTFRAYFLQRGLSGARSSGGPRWRATRGPALSDCQPWRARDSRPSRVGVSPSEMLQASCGNGSWLRPTNPIAAPKAHPRAMRPAPALPRKIRRCPSESPGTTSSDPATGWRRSPEMCSGLAPPCSACSTPTPGSTRSGSGRARGSGSPMIDRPLAFSCGSEALGHLS